jgi:hypothetical protein
MYDVAFLANRRRTPTSAFAVSMWHIPGGCNYDQATPITGFFEASEESDMDTFVARNANPPEMAFSLPIAAHDKAIATTIESLENRLRVYGAEMDDLSRQRLMDGIRRIQEENLLPVAA